MSNLRAMTRLLEIKQRAAEAAEAEAALAQNALLLAQDDAEQAETAWTTAATALPVVATMSDLEDHVTTVRLLRRIADAAKMRVNAARIASVNAQTKIAEARREVCRYETWLDRQHAALAEEARRQERAREDEHAARKRNVA